MISSLGSVNSFSPVILRPPSQPRPRDPPRPGGRAQGAAGADGAADVGPQGGAGGETHGCVSKVRVRGATRGASAAAASRCPDAAAYVLVRS